MPVCHSSARATCPSISNIQFCRNDDTADHDDHDQAADHDHFHHDNYDTADDHDDDVDNVPPTTTTRRPRRRQRAADHETTTTPTTTTEDLEDLVDHDDVDDHDVDNSAADHDDVDDIDNCAADHDDRAADHHFDVEHNIDDCSVDHDNHSGRHDQCAVDDTTSGCNHDLGRSGGPGGHFDLAVPRWRKRSYRPAPNGPPSIPLIALGMVLMAIGLTLTVVARAHVRRASS